MLNTFNTYIENLKNKVVPYISPTLFQYTVNYEKTIDSILSKSQFIPHEQENINNIDNSINIELNNQNTILTKLIIELENVQYNPEFKKLAEKYRKKNKTSEILKEKDIQNLLSTFYLDKIDSNLRYNPDILVSYLNKYREINNLDIESS